MSKIERSGSKEKSKRAGTRTIGFVLAFSMAALTVSGAAYGAKPTPNLNATVCQSISGTWASPTCTIPAGTDGVARSDFRIAKQNTLDVIGSLTINAEVTVFNSGTIIVENVGGVIPEYGNGFPAGILILGSLDNSGTITIGNLTDDTEGIGVNFSFNLTDPENPQVTPGVLTNSGTITIQNAGIGSQGINNLGVLNNAASGTITAANSSTDSTGIRNERFGDGQYLNGTITNAGSMTLANSGDGYGRGLSNAGSFTNSATGIFTINSSTVTDVNAYGMRNNGTFTNFGTFINNRGTYSGDPLLATWGSYNISPGAMMNYGKTYVGTSTDGSGAFYNEVMMINLGEITSYGVMYDAGAFMANYGTIYNYGLIVGGGNVGICIDEPGAPGGC
jgi:hypothetical protein